MNPETIKVIAEIFSGLGADTRLIVMWVVGAMLIRFVLGMCVVAYLIFRVTKIAQDLASAAMLTKKMQSDLGYHGELTNSERQHILRVWRSGLAAQDQTKSEGA